MDLAREYTLDNIYFGDLFGSTSAAELQGAYRKCETRSALDYLAVIRAHRIAENDWLAASEIRPDRNLSIGLTRLRLVTRQASSDKDVRSELDGLDHYLFNPIEETLERFASDPNPEAMTRFRTEFVRGFVQPVLRSLEKYPGIRNAAYALAHSRVPALGDAPHDPSELVLLLGLMRQQPSKRMAPRTNALLELIPEAGPLLHVIVAHHLRAPYVRGVDEVDPVMSSLAFVRTHRAFQGARGKDRATRGALAVSLVAGQTFTLGNKGEYLTHHVHCMTIARAQGCVEPEAAFVEAFQKFPRRLPPKAPQTVLAKCQDKELGHGFLKRVYFTRAEPIPTTGAWEFFTGAPEWKRTLKNSPINEEAEANYQFLRALRPPMRPTAEQLGSVPELLTLLESQIPPDFHPALFARTRAYLAHRTPAPDERQALAEAWSRVFDAPGVDYAAWEGDAVHPWMEASQGIARLLAQT
jgi:hypothetical protein